MKKIIIMALYKEYVKRGHAIANHTYTHGIFKGLYSSVDNFINAVKKQEEKIKTETDGYVDWTAEDGDGGNLTSRRDAWNNFTSTINSKVEIVLFHDFN